MKRRFSLPLALLASIVILTGVVSWIVYPEWSRANRGFWQLIALLLGSIVLFADRIVSFLKNWGELQEKEDLENPLRPITPEDIRKRMGRGGQVNWIDRGSTHVADLRAHGRLIICGKMKLGKTREAAELIRQAVMEDLVTGDRIFEPAPTLRFANRKKLQEAILRGLDPQAPALLLIDDLPYHYAEEGLDRLADALEALSAVKEIYVVATARTDELTEEHEQWLSRQRFQKVSLPDLEASQIRRLVDSASGVYGLQVPDDATQAFIEGRDGTPELTLIGIRRLSAEGVTQITEEKARQVTGGSLKEAWAAARRYIQDRHPASDVLFAAIGTFHANRVRAITSLVVSYANYLWQMSGKERKRWGGKRAIWTALNYLKYFDIAQERGVVIYPDAAVEGLIEAEEGRKNLAKYLVQHRHLLRHPILKPFYPKAVGHTSALFDLAFASSIAGEDDLSIALYSAAIRSDPYSGFYNNRGLAYVNKGELERAIADLDKAIALDPHNATTYYNRGLAYLDKGELERAIADYDQAIALDPHNATAYNNRGNAYANKGELERAIADYDQAIALDPEHAMAYYNRGNAYANKGELERAIADYDQAIALELRDALNYYNRGLAYFDKGELERAIADFDQAIALDPELTIAYSKRGSAFYDKGELERAIADYDQAIALDPEHATAFNNRGNAYAKKDELERAIADYDQAIALDPEIAAFYSNRGLACVNEGELERAIADLDKAIALDPRNGTAYYNRGLAYFDKGELERANADFDKAIALDPEHSRAYSNRGSAYHGQGRFEAAINDFNQAMAYSKDDADKAWVHRNRARALISLGKLEEAEEDCKAAERLAPDHPYLQFIWANLAYAKGQQHEAIELYRKAATLVDDSTEFNFDLGLPLLCLQREEDALEAIRDRLEANPDDSEIKQALRDYEKLKSLHPELAGVDEALTLLRGV